MTRDELDATIANVERVRDAVGVYVAVNEGDSSFFVDLATDARMDADNLLHDLYRLRGGLQ